MEGGRTWLSPALGWLVALVAGLVPGGVQAFSAPAYYDTDAFAGGGGGRWFSGSPAEGYSCAVCHTSAPGQARFPMYINGLPQQAGYQAGTTYAITLTWPEFQQRWAALRPDPSVKPGVGVSPGVSVVAELVAENGLASGTIEIDAEPALQDNLCEMRSPNARPRLGVSLYQVRVDVPAIEVQPDDDGVLRCVSRQLAQRCLIALSSCGAHRVDFRWTPPEDGDGPIWFSAGFVASEILSGTPERDAVYEVSVPLVSAESESGGYERTLQGAPCAVAPIGHTMRGGGALGAVLAVVGLVLLCRSRRRWRCKRAARIRFLLAVIVPSLSACLLEGTKIDEDEHPTAGLFTPGSRLGASDPTDTAAFGALGDRCMAPSEAPEDATFTEGTLILEYATQTIDGQYAPANVSAVWIENDQGEFIETIEQVGFLREGGLRLWNMRTCRDEEKVDVVTTATLKDHTMPHTDITWDGRDFNDRLVPDGEYSLYIEVTETDKADGYWVDYTFTKGPAPFEQQLQVDADGAIVRGSIRWTPEAGGGAGGAGM